MDLANFARYPSLRDKTVFVTGGGSGIGAAIVESFVDQGARVAFVDIEDEWSRRLCQDLKQQYGTAPLYIRCDIRDVAALQSTIDKVGRDLGEIGVLVNNAANDMRHDWATVTPDYWDDRMAINLRPMFFTVQSVIPQMKRLGGGSIINFGSITWLVGDGDCPAYVTAKAAITGLTRALAREFGPERIRVNCMVPGWVMTERQMKLWLTPEGERQIEDRQCLPDRLQPADIARMALFLASDDSRMCTSQNFIVDGGWV